MRNFVGALLLSGVLLSPVVMRADDHDRDDRKVRVLDPYRHDYHEWNENEERAYRHWVEQERHHEYREWKHASKKEQQEYWRWRHEHMDWR